jgi:ribosome-binding factor A
VSRRIVRVNELLLQEIARIVAERQHPDIGFITFTGVQTTDDLMEAKVFYSVLGTDEEKRLTARALDSMKHELLISMRRLESLKYIPHFHFIYDDTPSRAARVHDLIEKVSQEPPVPPLEEEDPANAPDQKAD